MSIGSIGAAVGATSFRPATASIAATTATPAEEQQESGAERQQEIGSGEESASAGSRSAQQPVGSTVNLLA